MFSEFQAFLVKTNALALAIGVIIGAALGTVVKSLVDDVIMPPIGLLLGGGDPLRRVHQQRHCVHHHRLRRVAAVEDFHPGGGGRARPGAQDLPVLSGVRAGGGHSLSRVHEQPGGRIVGRPNPITGLIDRR